MLKACLGKLVALEILKCSQMKEIERIGCMASWRSAGGNGNAEQFGIIRNFSEK